MFLTPNENPFNSIKKNIIKEDIKIENIKEDIKIDKMENKNIDLQKYIKKRKPIKI
jgi:hypothetical protein